MLTQNNSVMNTTSTVAKIPSELLLCRRFQEEEYFMANFLSTMVFTILNVLSCPVIIVMNVLVIVVVKTRPRLQSTYNILLACLAGTDLLVGTVRQPTVIATEIFAIAGGSVTTYCNITRNFIPRLVHFSLSMCHLHLAFISVERYMVIKYHLRYTEIVTKCRLTIAVTLSWFLVGLYTFLDVFRLFYPLYIYVLRFLLIFSLVIIVYCHIAVYVVTRRHQKQIRTEQISGEAVAKFLKEKKAWKTTGILIGFVLLSFLPGMLFHVWRGRMQSQNQSSVSILIVTILRPVTNLFLLLSSLCNPIIYCWRNKEIRKAIIAFVRRQTDQLQI